MIDRRRKKNDGTFPLKLLVTTYRRQFRIAVDRISVREEDWSESTHSLRSTCPELQRINAAVDRVRNKLYRTLSTLEAAEMSSTIPTDDVRRIIADYAAPCRPRRPAGNDLRSIFLSFAQNRAKPGTRAIYMQTFGKLDAFAPVGARIEDVDVRFLQAFEIALVEAGASTNGVNLHMRNLRAVVNHAIAAELVAATYRYPFRCYRLKSEPTRHRDLSVEDIRIIRDYKDPDKQRYVDMFMLSFYMAGINIGDLCLLKKSDMFNGRIVYRRQKVNGGEVVSIKIEPEMQAIIDKYAGRGEYLLNIMDTVADYHTFLNKMNKALKRLGDYEVGYRNRREYKPLYPFLSSYYARHTFATICSEDLDVDEALIDRMLGHSSRTLAGRVYINKKNRKADEAIRRLIDHVNAE